MSASYGKVMSFRLSQQERERLNMLAQRTRRPASQVLRLLIAQAEVADRPDIQVTPVTARHVEAGTIKDREVQP